MRYQTPLYALLVCSMLLLSACQPAVQQAAPLPDLRIGVAQFTQPLTINDLLAGYLPENQGEASPDDLRALDLAFAEMLRAQKREYSYVPAPMDTPVSNTRAALPGAFKRWVQQGKNANVDLLIVPMIISWTQRQGTEASVANPAAVIVDFYLLDVRSETGELVRRSVYNEQQVGLSSNLLTMGAFLERKGKWVTANELAQEGMHRAIKELGL